MFRKAMILALLALLPLSAPAEEKPLDTIKEVNRRTRLAMFKAQEQRDQGNYERSAEMLEEFLADHPDLDHYLFRYSLGGNYTLMGQTMAQISTRTGKAIRTIKLHRTEAFARLQVGSTGELWGLLFKMAGHELEPLSEHPVRWEELFKTCGATVDIDRIMRLTGRPRRVVIKKLKEYGYEVA